MKIYASDIARLDSSVINGGGTDVTDLLQAVLDKAPEYGRLHLIMDGAALVRGLKVHDNTTIECMDKSCGFYLADNSDCAVLFTARFSYDENVRTKNITLIGGTYNHNCLHQAHDVPSNDPNAVAQNMPEQYIPEECNHYTVALEFIGVENLNVRDVTVRDQRTFAFTVGNFKRVNIENTWIELENEIPFGNQDGFHFWGPGQFLTMRNVGGRTEDDFMNIGPDERDGESSITDVLIDGVFLDHAWQGIRMLSRVKGRLDRVTVRNVTGTYRSFGFYINPWFISDTNGNYGSITFENIDLRSEKDLLAGPNPLFLFSIGGDIESLTLRNIKWYHPYDNRNLLQIGYPYHDTEEPFVKTPKIGTLLIDGLEINETGVDNADTVYTVLRGIVERLIIRDVDMTRAYAEKEKGCFLKVKPDGEIGRLTLSRAYFENIASLLDLSDGKTELLQLENVTLNGVANAETGKADKTIGEFTDLGKQNIPYNLKKDAYAELEKNTVAAENQLKESEFVRFENPGSR